ncbi:hypothetical protein B7939_01090 [Eggerthia catenaformis]|nr:hypothetical protein B7939_01090 [Eggerthia catenaformis]
MTISDIINLVSAILSFVFSSIAIVISIKTLKQNSSMIEESTRPSIMVVCKSTNSYDPKIYLIVKNYGKSPGKITRFKCSIDLSKYSFTDSDPFKDLVGMTFAPGQYILTNIRHIELLKDNDQIIFDFDYSFLGKIYTETCYINLLSFKNLVQTRFATKDKELKIISYTLQDLVEKLL